MNENVSKTLKKEEMNKERLDFLSIVDMSFVQEDIKINQFFIALTIKITSSIYFKNI